jgi:hypothetical protein
VKIFISSTYIDLIEYRKAVETALNKLNVRHRMMENFGSQPEDPKTVALKEVEACDILIGVYAHRYGTIPEGDNKSVTEQEFDRAEELGKPIFVYRVHPDFPWPPKLIDGGSAKKKLTAFMKRVEKCLRTEFKEPKDLSFMVSTDLGNWLREHQPPMESKGPSTPVLEYSAVPLEIPSKYIRWVVDRCENMDVSKLLDSKDKVILVQMPQLFIPLYADPPEEKEADRKTEKEMFHEKRQAVDIEQMISKTTDYLLIEGQAGSGKSTLLKHLTYTMIKNESIAGLEGYLPILIYLKDLQAIACRLDIVTGSAAAGEKILTEYFREKDNGLNIALVEAYCQAGRALFLIDGLDEMEAALRDKVVVSLADLRCDYGCRMVLTGRPHGVEDANVLRCFGDHRIRINNLSKEQIETFIGNWFKYIYPAESGLDVKTAGEVIGEIRAHLSISKLLETPLMLTAICILYHNGGRLPEQRAELYKKFVDNLIFKRFDDPENVLSLLMRLAFTIHSKEVREFGRNEALAIMLEVFARTPEEADIQYRQRLDEKFTSIEQNCGLLKFETGHYEFWHLSFQEFMTARYLVEYGTNYETEMESYWDKDWYMEVVELFIGYLSLQSRGLAHGIIEKKLKEEDTSPFRSWRLAARCLLDIHKDVRLPDILALTKNKLVSIINRGDAPKVLAEAGETLGWLGDTRPLSAVIPIEGGEYLLKGLAKTKIKPFEIGTCPVTNQWYQKFVEAKGYENKAWWSPEGQKWLAHTQAILPKYWFDRDWRCPNAPVVGVSWFEADAFCRWLSLSENDGYDYRLPTESEWQVAAAGKEGREYPWGKDWHEGRCNTYEADIGRTSPVGIFVAGRTPEGVYDLSGNVWEWTRSDYKTKINRDEFEFNLQYDSGNEPVLRGGSWDINLNYARCARRGRNFPDDRLDFVGFRCSRTKK